MTNLYTVVMAGGSGTRFWPASRAHRPKQLLALGANADEVLIGATIRRIAPLCSMDRTLVVTGRHLVAATQAALPELPAKNLLAEPVARNTAPCIGWATAVIARRDPGAVVMVLPSDHFVADEVGFRETLTRAIAAADAGAIATVGIEPTGPETGYGYIQMGEPIGPRVFAGIKFVEKPNVERAKQLIAMGHHAWNSGMFFFRAQRMLDAIRTHLPDLAIGLDRIDQAAKKSEGDEQAELERVFPTFSSISIDHGVMEKASSFVVVTGTFGWNDVGSWQSAWELAPKDAAGNAVPDHAVLVDARGNLVRDLRTHSPEATGDHTPSGVSKGHAGKRVIALVGVHDLAIVETDDALLVIPRARAQEVRAVLDLLHAGGHKDKT